jgi:N-acetylglutamate synthase-like GNAT family acetyltransferase
LGASQLELLDWGSDGDPSQYLLATTAAGGIAACAGWTRVGAHAVMHSLAVAPPSRGSGVGGALFAMAMGALMDEGAVSAVYLGTHQARRFFQGFGFEATEGDLPELVAEHPAIRLAGPGVSLMVRRYHEEVPRGLDQRAFRLLHNATSDATLPMGSVMYFRQRDLMLEASYRGGVVSRGQLLGHVEQDRVRYVWQGYLRSQVLLQGQGELVITALEDGRRELREEDEEGGDALLMREI